MSFDKADWHFDSALEEYCKEQNKIPDNLTEEDEDIIWECASHHIALFYTWVLEHDALDDDIHDCEENINAVKNRKMTGYEYFMNYSDLKFTESDVLKDKGRIYYFIKTYYNTNPNLYLEDYCECFKDSPNYSRRFSWEDYDLIKPYINKAYKTFLKGKLSTIKPRKHKKTFLDFIRGIFHV